MVRAAQPNVLMRMPLFLLIWGIAAASMFVPASHALVLNNHPASRSFFYAGLLGLIAVTLIALAMGTRPARNGPVAQLLSLLGTFAVLPVFLAIPFHDALGTTSFLNAYMEMVSAITTTGAPVFEDPGRLIASLHLWRAQVGWMGGLVMWIAASAILAPLALGGFEVTASGEPGQSVAQGAMNTGPTSPAERLMRSAHVLFPVYTGLTLALTVMLLVAGDPPLVAVSHAMSVMATSGITPLAELGAAPSGMAGEMILFCFLFFALSRLTFSADTRQERGLFYDPEFRLGMIIVVAVPLAMFLRHWAASFEVGEEQNWIAGLRALWGGLFTAASFLTTTGFVSGDWATAQGWSGLPTPGIILMGLSLVGGGVATTAGGVKLLRVYALYLNGKREIERLVHPHSVGRAGPLGRRIRREGAFIAWVFFMFFALTLAAMTLILGAYGVDFERATVLTIATLSNTGPLIDTAAAIDLSAIPWDARLILCGAMVLGRLELLAIIVMISPEIWRE